MCQRAAAWHGQPEECNLSPWEHAAEDSIANRLVSLPFELESLAALHFGLYTPSHKLIATDRPGSIWIISDSKFNDVLLAC